MPTAPDTIWIAITGIGDRIIGVVVGTRRHHLAATFTYRRYRQPPRLLLGPRHFFHDALDIIGSGNSCRNECIHLARAIELGGTVVARSEADRLVHGNKLCSKVFSIIIKSRFGRRHSIERLAEVLFEACFVEVPWNGVEGGEVVQLVTILNRYALLREHLCHETVYGDTTHAPHVY